MTVANAGGLRYNMCNDNPINKAAPEGACNTNGSLTHTRNGGSYVR